MAKTDAGTSQSIGKGGQKSRQQAETAAKRTGDQQVVGGVPQAEDGFPLVEVSIAASELIPTGQFANVSVGPAVAKVYVDPREDDPLPRKNRDGIRDAMLALADTVEYEVVAPLRAAILESIQAQQQKEKD